MHNSGRERKNKKDGEREGRSDGTISCLISFSSNSNVSLICVLMAPREGGRERKNEKRKDSEQFS